MLPSRAYADPLPVASTSATAAEPRPILVVAVSPADSGQFNVARFTCLQTRNTPDTVRAIERTRPRIAAVDLDAPEFDVAAICAASHHTGCTSVLVTTATPARAPIGIKAGCQGVLLKPFAPAILASRLGRLTREPLPIGVSRRATTMSPQHGTNRTWPGVACPKCAHDGVVSFEFHSYRRMWYACLACETVWLGPRRE
jgi:hypothetical protein